MNLERIKVLDLSRVLSGPYCTSLLSDLGADVVKVESPSGDDARHLGPFKNGQSVYFAQLNRGKRSIALDLKVETDRTVMLELIEKADVLVENFRPGVAKRLGVDYATVREINPKIIYASISGFGQDGPLSDRPAYDLIVQAMSGLMSATGHPEGTPTRVGESVGDVIAGIFAAWSISTALFSRERDGEGQYLDISMLDVLVSIQVTAMSILAATGALPGRIGNRHPISVPFDTFRTKDGAVAIAVANDALFARFATMVERPELSIDPHYATDGARSNHGEELKDMTVKWTSQFTTSEILLAAGEHGVPAGPIWDFEEALKQTEHRGLVGTFQDACLGLVPYLRQPVRFSKMALPNAQGSVGDGVETSDPSPILGADLADVVADWLRRAA